MAGMKTASGDYIDSSWELRVFVGEEDPEAQSVTLRVTGESHIGGVLLKIVEEISIRHPEELSLLRAPEKKEKKKKEKEPEEEVHDLTKVVLAGGVAPTLFRGMPAHFSDSAQTEACYHMLSRPQPAPDPLLLQRLPRPSSLPDKTQLHSRWLDSSRCLMQQGIKAGDVLWLRFKYYSFF